MAPASRPTQSPVVVAAGKTVGGREVALAESEQLRRSRGQAAPEYRKLDAGQLGGAAPADAKAKYEGQLALANSVERKNEEVAKQQMRQLKAVDELQKDVDAEVDNRGGFNREGFDAITDNPFKLVADAHFSTFSIDVDTASYANVRRMVMGENRLPPAGAVRIEEMINYFPYYYDEPQGDDPFSANVEVAAAPWNTSHRLVRIGLHGKNVMKERPEANLVFLVDVSGSMNQPNKIGYVRQSLELLTKELDADDRIAIVVYAGAAGLVLDSTPVGEKEKILTALDRLRAGGSTNGGAGIQLAYKIATDHFVKGGINRVILCSDGDFNVGISDRASLIKLIEEKRESGVFLTTLGFGNGNLRDSQMEQLADKGNGAYNYIDSMREAKKVLCDELGGTLVTIAKDVKIQIDFNPAKVQAYRLIGYENRVLADEDFNDDRKDAGEIGSGHTVTALYEIVPVGVELAGVEKPGKVDDSVFQPKPVAPAANVPAELSDKLMLLKLRFKQPDGDTSVLRTFPVVDSGKKYDQATQDYKFAAAVAQFGMLLRNSPYKGSSNYDAVLELAGESIGKDKGGYRAEFVQIVEKAKALSTR
ncbi:MAG: DUF3520 domain-containing protein [Phycisphaera sp.]|nr:DUF3520 domain-containing protein [Phycisphaera sp.]